jgi:hypothetical protein
MLQQGVHNLHLPSLEGSKFKPSAFIRLLLCYFLIVEILLWFGSIVNFKTNLETITNAGRHNLIRATNV